MKIDWGPLRAGLKNHRASGLALPLWWRDDDAVAATPALETLTRMSSRLSMPVHIAVIPNPADQSLVAHISTHANVLPLVHGWRHINHAPPEQKKAEFNTERSDARAELQHALAYARDLFADRLLPLFVPPWNRIHPEHIRALAGAGYRGLSTFGARPAPCATPGLVQINTHVDPIDWHGTRDLKDPEALIASVVELLKAREKSEADTQEPLGYLTHHLVHTAKLWDFSESFLSEMQDGGAHAVSLRPILEPVDEPT